VEVTSDPFEWTGTASGGRYRAEVRVDGKPRTVTANLWMDAPVTPPPSGCGCSSMDGWPLLALLLRPRRRGGLRQRFALPPRTP
ncbi:MAG TPA: hypothetical protein VGE37_06695, partial [Archangium sp.]